MLNFIAQWRRERVAVRELTRLNDHRLVDLGITRLEIKSIARAAASVECDGVFEAATPRGSDLVGDMAPSWGSHNRRALA